MDEATWTAVADTNNIPDGERDHILGAAELWVELHPQQARGLNGYAIAAARVSPPPGPRRPVSREEHRLPDRTVWPDKKQTPAWRNSPDRTR